VAAALITITGISTFALIIVVVRGFIAATPAEIGSHVTHAIFTTLMVLLSHSLTMFYLIGKGRAIREAVGQGGLSTEFVRTFGTVRRPVFGSSTLAIALTMATAILGGGVDTGSLPTAVHSVLALLAVASNLHAVRAEMRALTASDRIVRDVNRLLGA
jgi:hypothetical protein